MLLPHIGIMLKFLHLFVVKRTPRNYDRSESGQWGTTHNMSVEMSFLKVTFCDREAAKGLQAATVNPPALHCFPPHQSFFVFVFVIL